MAHNERLRVVLDATASVALIVLTTVTLVDRYRLPRLQPEGSLQRIAPVHIDSRSVTDRIGSGSVMMIEFADYQCPYCAKHATDVFPQVRKNLVESGKISYAYVQFPLANIHPLAVKLSSAAKCAGQQDKFWQLHGHLFAAATNATKMTSEQLLREAQSAGLDVGRFETCLASPATTAAVNHDVELGKRLGVEGTPTFYLGTLNGDGSISVTAKAGNAQSFDKLKAEIDQYATGPTPWWSASALMARLSRGI
jgi:protein-disulfide isomerase